MKINNYNLKYSTEKILIKYKVFVKVRLGDYFVDFRYRLQKLMMIVF